MKEESLVKPSPLKGVESRRALLIPFDSATGTMKRELERTAVRKFRAEGNRYYELKESVVLYGCIGASNTVLALEKLIASGIEEVILLGICGSLDSGIRMFEAVSVTEAFVEEGTSRCYFPERDRFYPSDGLKKTIEIRLTGSGLSRLSGSIISTDAPYRETMSWLKEKQERGIQTVDMETSAIFSVSEFHGIQSAALQIVSDELFSGGWEPGFGQEELGQAMTVYFFPFLERGSPR